MRKICSILLVTALFSIPAATVHAKETVKYASANIFALLGYGTEHVGVYPYLGVLSYYMTLPSIKGKYELRYVSNVYKSPNECLSAVASGAVQMTYAAPPFLEQYNPNWKIVTAPGLFDDFSHFRRTVNTPAWRKLIKELEEKQRIKVIKWVGSLGSFMIFTNKPVDKLEDLKGMRIRYNGAQGYAAALSKFQTTPIALPFTEVVSALQTNMIDGLISEIQAAPWYDLQRYAKHLVPITWVSSPMCIVVNADWWEKLDPKTKEVFTYAFETPDTYEFLDNDEARQIEEWGTVTPNTVKSNFSSEEHQRWVTELRAVGTEFARGVPQELLDAIEQSRKQ